MKKRIFAMFILLFIPLFTACGNNEKGEMFKPKQK